MRKWMMVMPAHPRFYIRRIIRRINHPAAGFEGTYVPSRRLHIGWVFVHCLQSLVEETVGKGVLLDADWNPSRANVLTLTLKGGIKVRRTPAPLCCPG